MKTRGIFHALPAAARILFIRLRSMGDCLLLTGPVRVLKEEFPGFRLTVLVESRFAGCFDGNPDFSEVLVAGSKLATAARLAGRRYDLIVNLHGGPTSLIYACLARGPRIGTGQYQYLSLYHGVAPKPDSTQHTVDSTMALFRWLGAGTGRDPALRFEFHPTEAARLQAELDKRPYVVIHPAAVMATKRWEPQLFASVARDLAARGFTVVVTGGPGDEQLVNQVAREVNGTRTFTGLTIPELAELIRGARLYIGNDSGPMHLAAAVHTPTVAVWGSSDARRWHPWEVQHRVVQNHFECNPCPGYRCLVAESPLCIESVSVEQVNAAVKELLGEPAVAGTQAEVPGRLPE